MNYLQVYLKPKSGGDESENVNLNASFISKYVFVRSFTEMKRVKSVPFSSLTGNSNPMVNNHMTVVLPYVTFVNLHYFIYSLVAIKLWLYLCQYKNIFTKSRYENILEY